MITQHAPLPPSGAPQWGYCSGSIMANMQAVGVEHPRTRAGTASHWVESECLVQWKDPDASPPTCNQWLNLEAPNGVVIDEEMAEGAQVFVDHVLQVAQKHGALQAMMIEHRVNMPNIHKSNWGTLDACIALFRRDGAGRVMGGIIYLMDYKFGHREVKAYGHLQLIDYLVGICNEFEIDGHAEQQTEVVFQVVQPFCYRSEGPVDEWRTTVADLRGYVNQLIAQAAAAFSNPTFTSGPHCRDCLSLGRCSIARKAKYHLLDYVDEPCVIDNMNDRDLAVEFGVLQSGQTTLKARIDALEAELKHRIKNGSTGSGLALETAVGNLDWDISAEQAVILARQFQVDATKPGVLTPTQTISAASGDMKPLLEKAIKTVTSRPPRGFKLIKAADSISARAFTNRK